MTTEMKATEQYFPVLLFIMLYMLVPTFESVDEILNPSSPKSDQHQISPCNINDL